MRRLLACLLLVAVLPFAPAEAQAQRRSFRDPVTHVLKAHGFISANDPGDLAREEPEDFRLEPGQWRWNGRAWEPFVSPPAPPDAHLHLPHEEALEPLIEELLNEIDARSATPVDRPAFRRRLKDRIDAGPRGGGR